MLEVKEHKCKVHYKGWKARYDEWVPLHSQRLVKPASPVSSADPAVVDGGGSASVVEVQPEVIMEAIFSFVHICSPIYHDLPLSVSWVCLVGRVVWLSAVWMLGETRRDKVGLVEMCTGPFLVVLYKDMLFFALGVVVDFMQMWHVLVLTMRL